MPISIALTAALTAAAIAFAGDVPAPQPPAWPDLSIPAREQGDGSRDAAVIVGISDYAFAPDIPGATTNAEDWYAYLTVTRGVPARHVRLMRDNEGSAEEIFAAIRRAASQATKGGRVWFVFIGHGAPARSGDDGLLIAVDAQQTANSLETRSLRQSDVIAALEQSKAAPVVILDACFSGKAGDGSSLAAGLQPLQVAELAVPESALVLTAAKSDQYAGELPTLGRPAFSYLALGALRGWGDDNGDGRVTAGEAVAFAEWSMLTVISGRSQTPQLHSSSPDVVLSHAAEKGPDLRTITLGRSLAQPSAPSPSLLPTELAGGGSPPQLLPAAQEDLRAKMRTANRAGIGLAAGGAALAITGGALWGVSNRTYEKAANAYFGSNGSCGTGDPCGDESAYDEASAKSDRQWLAGVSLTVVGIAAVVGGTAALTVGGVRKRRLGRLASVGANLSRTHAGVTLTARF